jgi:ankyrin repeat protein
VVKLLLGQPDVEADSKDRGGRPSLSWAAEREHGAVVKLLTRK